MSTIDLIGWIGNICFIIGALSVAHKHRVGFLFNIGGNSAYLTMGIATRTPSLWFISSLFVGLGAYAFFKWGKSKESEKNRI